jgi:hypothetical protein
VHHVTIGDVSLRARVAHVVEVNVLIQRRSAEIRGGTLAAAISMRACAAAIYERYRWEHRPPTAGLPTDALATD